MAGRWRGRRWRNDDAVLGIVVVHGAEAVGRADGGLDVCHAGLQLCAHLGDEGVVQNLAHYKDAILERLRAIAAAGPTGGRNVVLLEPSLAPTGRSIGGVVGGIVHVLKADVGLWNHAVHNRGHLNKQRAIGHGGIGLDGLRTDGDLNVHLLGRQKSGWKGWRSRRWGRRRRRGGRWWLRRRRGRGRRGRRRGRR